MIDAIEESRMELRGTMLDFEDETEQLRAESRMLGKSICLFLFYNDYLLTISVDIAISVIRLINV
jgi:hypothetical protein